MGIRFYCPNGHKLNVKSFQAGRRGICPFCGAKIIIPTQSTRRSTKAERAARRASSQAQAEQEITLQADPGQQPLPVASQAVQAAGASRADRGGHSAGTGAGAPTQGGALPVATLLAGQDCNSGASPQRPNDAAPLATTVIGPSPLANAQTASAEPAQTAPALQAGAQVASPVRVPPATPAHDAPQDPLTEAGNVVWYVRPPSGGQFGPATSDVMRTWLSEGRVSDDSLVWREGWRDWLVAGKVFPQLGAGKNEFAFKVEPSESAAKPALGRTRAPRSRRQEVIRQVGIITSLVLAVLVLVGVFGWVLMYNR